MPPSANRFPEPQRLNSWQEEMDAIALHIKDKARDDRALQILEAGCGKRWGLDLKEVRYTLTGVDYNKDALDFREQQVGDLDIAILGDLLTVNLDENWYDVIFNSNVLEHVDGAEKVLDNFFRWLKPDGMLALIIPNRDSAKGFLTKSTPFWFHVFYKKHIQGWKDAGKPGTDPFPTCFDKVVSRNGMRKYCEKRGLNIVAEYYSEYGDKNRPFFQIMSTLVMWLVCLASFGRLSAGYTELVYIVKRGE